MALRKRNLLDYGGKSNETSSKILKRHRGLLSGNNRAENAIRSFTVGRKNWGNAPNQLKKKKGSGIIE